MADSFLVELQIVQRQIRDILDLFLRYEDKNVQVQT